MLGFGQLNGPVAGGQLPRLDRPRTQPLAVGTSDHGLRGLGLPGRGRFREASSQATPGLVSLAFEGGEVEILDLVLGSEDLALDLLQKQPETRIEWFVSGGGAEHGGHP